MKARRIGTVILLLGLALVIGAAGLAFYNVRTEQAAGGVRDNILRVLAEAMPSAAADAAPEPEPEPAEWNDPNAPLPVVRINGLDYIGTMSIPALQLELPVLKEWSYPNLKIAPSVYYGSIPTNDMVICAHNYRTHFGTLKNLTEGDQVLFRSMTGTIYTYEVAAMEIVSPLATADVTSGEWDLTLFTCTLGGRTRQVIRCDRVDVP